MIESETSGNGWGNQWWWGTMAMDGKHYSQGIHPKTHPLAISKTKKKSNWEEEEKHFFSFILDIKKSPQITKEIN